MKLKKCLAILLSAALLCTAAVSVQPKTEAQAEEIIDLKLQDRFSGGIQYGKNVPGGTIPVQQILSYYSAKISYMYGDSYTGMPPQPLRVDKNGMLDPTGQNTGTSDVTVNVQYDLNVVYSVTEKITVEKAGEDFVVKNEAGEEVEQIVAPAVRFEVEIEDPSVVTMDAVGKVTVLSAGKTNLVLNGYVGDTLFAQGKCPIEAEGMELPPSEEPSQEPSVEESQEPFETIAPVPTPSTAPEPSPSAQPQRKKGDVDGDNAISLKDAQMVLRAALHLTRIEDEESLNAADVNGSGGLELADAQTILRMALHLI